MYDTSGLDLRVLVQNVGGQAATRIPSAISQQRGCDIYGFVETMLTDSTTTQVEHLAPGYTVWHCARPQPLRGRPSGGTSVFVKQDSALYRSHGFSVTSDPAAGIVWVVSPAYQLTIAVCYFSPPGSAVYGGGLVHPDPMSVLFAGLRDAEGKGHKHLIMGDLNIRIGRLCLDVPELAIPPPLQEPTVLPNLHHLSEIPQHRGSMDTTIPSRSRAETLLNGLFAASSVVLNGRAPGDEAGSHTCWQGSEGGQITGCSVVDLACVSVALYKAVQLFCVLPFQPSTSKDHSALFVLIRGLRPRCREARPRRRTPVYRPGQGSGYVAALIGAQPRMRAMLRAWRQGNVPTADAVNHFVELLVSCAGEGRSTSPAPTHNGDQLWFDADCRALARALDDAWASWHTSRGGIYGSQEGCPAAKAALQAARRAYKARCKERKREFELRSQIQLLETYFGPEQKDYWRVFFSERAPSTPLSDVGAWTEYFRALLCAPMAPMQLSTEDADLKNALYASAPKGTAEQMSALNDSVTLEEARQCMGLPTGRAADLQGHTGELLRWAGSMDRAGRNAEPQLVCPAAVECVQWLLQSMLSTATVPDQLRVGKLVPVPKSLQPTALANRDMYRGITVSAIFSRLLDRLLNKRLEAVASGLGLRSPTQCGFRPGYGALDGIFTLHHLISAAQHHRQRLYVVFVDFKKAFDTVRRDLLIERCQQLGIHGAFMNLLVSLYDRVCARVVVNGQVGAPFTTTAGTKQGSELSPLLFGLFIELLHELIRLKAPGAGPVLGGLRVPDIMYADDVTLIGHSPGAVQQLLDVLDVFCRLFGMEVNLAPTKTCVVVFRAKTLPAPRGLRLTYRGHLVSVQQQYVYLGTKLHETRGLADAPAALAASGSKAMHALLTRCRRTNLTQFDIKGRMFDVLVEPVLSYASHVWGPLALHRTLGINPFSGKAEQVHAAFLRIMTGVGKSASLDVLYRDLHRLPIMFHWVALAVRWWNRLHRAHGAGPECMASYAWVEDVKLALAGCKHCWASHLLTTLARIGLIEAGWRQQPLDWVLQQHWEESVVKHTLAGLFKARWQMDNRPDPRVAPSRGVAMCMHHSWVYPLDPALVEFKRDNAPAYTKLCLPFVVLRTLAQLRIGWAHLEVEQGRKRRPQVPRAQRLCRLCSCEDAPLSMRQQVLLRTGTSHNVEDLKHFLLECPAYDSIRAGCRAFPPNVYSLLHDRGCLPAIFAHEAQSSLAYTVFKMKSARARILGLTNGI